jgi:cell division protein ZapE
MDLFYQSLPGERKQRLHFHRFMLRVHEELTTLQGTAIRWRLSPTASRRKPTCSVSMSFCLRYYRCHAAGRPDESPVRRGITLVATSNIPPDELYRNGLQRARFLPAIDAIKQHCDIMNVDAGIDYRCAR